MLLIINPLEMPEVAPLPNIIELETPVVLVTVFGPMYILLETAVSLAPFQKSSQ